MEGESKFANMNPYKKLLVILILGFLECAGLGLLIIACALKVDGDTYWFLLCDIIAFILAPIPQILCSRVSRDDLFGGGNRGWPNAGAFLTAIIVLSAFGYPIVLFHADAIELQPFLLSMAAALVTDATSFAFVWVLKKDSSGF